jgi:hypothetical protein
VQINGFIQVQPLRRVKGLLLATLYSYGDYNGVPRVGDGDSMAAKVQACGVKR